jgi:capsular exopolysaccharide synthesis family protein
VSRVYDALRKLEEQGREQPINAVPKTVVVSSKSVELLSVPSVQARIGPESRLVVFSDRRSPGAERFRLIRMALRNNGKTPKVLLITSPLPQDGKSTMALNLATTLAEEGRVKVLLVEADLHRPSLCSHLGLERLCGITEVVEDSLEMAEAVRRVDPLGFYLMPAGRPPLHPNDLLQSERFVGVLRDLRNSFDWVLLDCPPAFPLADVVALRPHADNVLLVARAGSTPREAVQETFQLFKPGHVAGLILNGASVDSKLYSHYYYAKGSEKK